ncbi:eliciting plant response-like protein [Trichoderma sp. SZMC 28014]
MLLLGICQVAAIVSLASAETVSVTFNTLYDDPSRSLSEVACWKEGTGFKPNLDWQIQKDALGFIGIDAIHGPSQAQCFSCWKLEYGDKQVSMFAIDGANAGFVLSLNAMQFLTSGQARELVRVDMEATQVDVSNCGLSAAELHQYDL